jgi:outer membrane autotransporter protein
MYDAGINNSLTGSGAAGSVRGGVRLAVSPWNLEPRVMLSGLSLNQNGVAETGAGLAGLRIAGGSIGSIQTTTAIEVDRRFALGGADVLVPSARLGWAYEALDTGAPVTASFLGLPGSGFSLTSASIGRSATVAGVHTVLETGTAVQAFAGYDAAFNSRAAEQSVAGGLLYRF